MSAVNNELRDDVFCNNLSCDSYSKCRYSAYAMPIDGTFVLLVNLKDTEYCEKYELS